MFAAYWPCSHFLIFLPTELTWILGVSFHTLQHEEPLLRKWDSSSDRQHQHRFHPALSPSPTPVIKEEPLQHHQQMSNPPADQGGRLVQEPFEQLVGTPYIPLTHLTEHERAALSTIYQRARRRLLFAEALRRARRGTQYDVATYELRTSRLATTTFVTMLLGWWLFRRKRLLTAIFVLLLGWWSGGRKTFATRAVVKLLASWLWRESSEDRGRWEEMS